MRDPRRTEFLARSPQMLDTSMSHLGFRCVEHTLGVPP
jgi:hypothetical protein